MIDAINEVDAAFVIDTTGSMGPFIGAAKTHLVRLLDTLTHAADISLRVGIVEYRDHVPQDRVLTRVYSFTSDLATVQRRITDLTPDGGGDGAEAVLDGIVDACRKLEWRRHARRLCVLVGDAPPHGTGFHDDNFPRGCPCGESMESIAALCEETGITLYALGLTFHVKESFGKLASATGGAYHEAGNANRAIEQMGAVLKVEFGNLELDRRVYTASQEDENVPLETLAEQWGMPRAQVAASWVRLCSRGLLKEPVKA